MCELQHKVATVRGVRTSLRPVEVAVEAGLSAARDHVGHEPILGKQTVDTKHTYTSPGECTEHQPGTPTPLLGTMAKDRDKGGCYRTNCRPAWHHMCQKMKERCTFFLCGLHMHMILVMCTRAEGAGMARQLRESHVGSPRPRWVVEAAVLLPLLYAGESLPGVP